jgi:hypothetical protein
MRVRAGSEDPHPDPLPQAGEREGLPLARARGLMDSERITSQSLDQGPEMALVIAPALRGCLGQRLADLCTAGRHHRPLGAVEIETGRVPSKPGKLNQPS